MLIPRFTVRWLLVLTAACALLAFVVSLGIGGSVWAMSLAITLGSLILTVLLYAAAFLLAWAAAAAWRWSVRRASPASPFAMHTAPPQLLIPEEPD
jgi:hypothetical protein